jgi:hypothetical protein
VNGLRVRAADAGGQYAPAALYRRFWAAPQLHRHGALMYRVASALLATNVNRFSAVSSARRAAGRATATTLSSLFMEHSSTCAAR